VTSSPSRIQAVPGPATTIRWKRATAAIPAARAPGSRSPVRPFGHLHLVVRRARPRPTGLVVRAPAVDQRAACRRSRSWAAVEPGLMSSRRTQRAGGAGRPLPRRARTRAAPSGAPVTAVQATADGARNEVPVGGREGEGPDTAQDVNHASRRGRQRSSRRQQRPRRVAARRERHRGRRDHPGAGGSAAPLLPRLPPGSEALRLQNALLAATSRLGSTLTFGVAPAHTELVGRYSAISGVIAVPRPRSAPDAMRAIRPQATKARARGEPTQPVSCPSEPGAACSRWARRRASSSS
jgi:hypothetical protein